MLGSQTLQRRRTGARRTARRTAYGAWRHAASCGVMRRQTEIAETETEDRRRCILQKMLLKDRDDDVDVIHDDAKTV
jgi:hypothetical protein